MVALRRGLPAGARSACHRVVQLVPGFAVWGREVVVRTLGGGDRHRLDDRVEPLGDELFALFARLPDVEDAEDAGVMVKAGRMKSGGRQGRLED